MDRIKVGVIGAGRMGRNHCRVYSSLRQVDLVGVHDLDAELGQKVAQQHQAQFYADVDKLVKRVDAVSIATPTPAHFEMAMRCLDRDVHVLIEKPVTETLEQVEALVEAAEQNHLIVQVGHIERFNPAYREVKNVVEGMSVLSIDFQRLSAFEGSNKDVDVVMDLMIHDADLALDLMAQEPESVSAVGLKAFSGSIDHAHAVLRFSTGQLLTLTASRTTEQKVRSIAVTATEAYLTADLLRKTVEIHRRTSSEYLNHNQSGVKYRQEAIVERIHVPGFEPLYLELEHFAGCVMEDRLPIVSVRDGMRALKLAIQIRDAVNDNLSDRKIQPVALEPMPAGS